MLTNAIINHRLEEMQNHGDTSTNFWPENCDGSRIALVIFIGPSPGGKKAEIRRDIVQEKNIPLWNKPYDAPLNWGGGFKKSFQPIVEAIFEKPYKIASKLIARFNMDWMKNPESDDVPYYCMWQGFKYALPRIYECNPELIIAMDEKTYGVLQIALDNDGFRIEPHTYPIKLPISGKSRKKRYHHKILSFKATRGEFSFLIINLLQHPARIFNLEYARRIGVEIRKIALQN